MKKRGKIIITTGIFAVILVAAFITVRLHLHDKNSYMDKVNNLNNFTSASFASHADSIDELISISKYIVEGKVVDYKPENIDGIILTNETVEIKKVIKGDISEGDKINVVVTGGELNGAITPPIEDCPIMDMRGNYMLFVNTHDGENYYIIGGNQGFGLIKDNKIQSAEKDVLGDKIRSYKVDDLEKEIKDNLSLKKD